MNRLRGLRYRGSEERAILILVLSIVAQMYILKVLYGWCCII